MSTTIPPVLSSTVPLPIGGPITQVKSKLADGKDTLIDVPTSLTGETASFFNVFSPHLTAVKDFDSITYTYLKSLPKIPVGTSIALSALSPPLGKSLPTSTAAVIDYVSPAKFKWRVYKLDFDDSASDPTPAKSAFTGLNDVQPSATTESVGGLYQLSRGDLLSSDLSIIPWPCPDAPVGNEALAPNKWRAFAIRLEISLWAPKMDRATFLHPITLVGVLESWSSVFGTGSLSVPSTPSTTGDDKLAFLRTLFERAVDTLAPEVGKAATLVVNAVDKTSTVPGVVSQILEKTPQVNIQAGLDIGGYFAGIAGAIGGATGSPPDPSVNAALVNVGKVLSSVLSIPIAVDINGITRTKTIIPSTPVAIPSIKGLPGSTLLGGSLPIGTLNTLLKADLNNASIKTDNTDGATGDVPYVLKTQTPGIPGLGLIPLPRVSPIASDKDQTVKVTVTVPVNLTIPGRMKPLVVSVELPSITLKVPSIRVPQVALLFRAFQKDFPNYSDYAREILALPDPYTSRACRKTGVKAILDTFIGTLRQVTKLFPEKLFPADKIPPAIATYASLLDGAQRMYDTLVNPKSLVTEFLIPESEVGAAQSSTYKLSEITQNGGTKDPWYKSTIGAADNVNCSSLMWFGMPSLDPDNSYHLRIPLTGDSIPILTSRAYGSLWIPLPKSTVTFFTWSGDENAPDGGGWAKPAGKDPVENGEEQAASQASGKEKPAWNDQPKFLNWVKGTSRVR